MAMINNQCLKLVYQLREDDFPGGAAFANHWNTGNFMGTLIPMTNGFIMKHETLASRGVVVGNIAKTLVLFSEAVDRFQNEWFELTSA